MAQETFEEKVKRFKRGEIVDDPEYPDHLDMYTLHLAREFKMRSWKFTRTLEQTADLLAYEFKFPKSHSTKLLKALLRSKGFKMIRCKKKKVKVRE
jgi:hypothetical protein